MSKENNNNFYSVPQYTDQIFNQLGINNSNISNSFIHHHYQTSHDKQFHTSDFNKHNKYRTQQINHNDQPTINVLNKLSLQQKKRAIQPHPQPPPQTIQSIQNLQNIKNPKQQTTSPKNKKRQVKKKHKKSKLTQQKKNPQINVDQDIDMNQVAQWCQKGTNISNQDQDNFQQNPPNTSTPSSQISQNSQQKQAIKRKLQQKLTQNSFTTLYKSSQSKNTLDLLKNKIKQLKQQKSKTLSLPPQLSQIRSSQIKQYNQQIYSINSSHNQQKSILCQNNQYHQQAINDQDDPWNIINLHTLQTQQKKLQQLKFVQKIDINHFYQNIILPEEDIDLQQQPHKPTNFLGTLCKCLRTHPKKLTELSKHLLKLSKLPLTNTPQQVQILRQLWTRLTNKKYQKSSRYGQHWNQIGFQGRDPATDLRSTGILSLIQWYNFVRDYSQYQQKLLQFCIEFDIPLALTHIKITSLFCIGIKNHLITCKKWQQYQQWYNALLYYTFQYIKQNIQHLNQIGQLVQTAIQRTKSNFYNAKKKYHKYIQNHQ